ncbi:hypothetical protein FHU38_002701 [Saccharomonospora amisosensis]|uniref:Transmembrane protein n=1 Tax=Saccharomonospora amisosensis TaxID=1128677 RepID=A0A7X5ZR20_9PSEU|nr:hypothetical protein [Saccharomonospora amisosensis]
MKPDPATPRSDTWLLRLWRRVHLGSNPLARTSDRLERLVLVMALAVPLLATPFVAALGSETYTREVRVAQEQQSSREQTTAVLLAEPPSARATAHPASAQQPVPVRARWSVPDGGSRTGTVMADPAKEKGSQVHVWVDDSGAVVPPPTTTTAAGWNAAALAATVWLLVAVASALFFLSVRRILDRSRYQRWQREWEQLERERHQS